jgi:hypothetical protein
MFGMDNNEMAMASSLLLGCAAQAPLLALLVRRGHAAANWTGNWHKPGPVSRRCAARRFMMA